MRRKLEHVRICCSLREVMHTSKAAKRPAALRVSDEADDEGTKLWFYQSYAQLTLRRPSPQQTTTTKPLRNVTPYTGDRPRVYRG